jgi:hypothetical protein
MRIQPRPAIPPAAPDTLKAAWSGILERFDHLDIDIAHGKVQPDELAARIEELGSEADYPAIAQAYGLGLHAAWVRSFEDYFKRWAEVMPDAVAQRTSDGRAVTLNELVLRDEVGIAVQDQDKARLDALERELATRFPDSWVTGWAKAEQSRFVPQPVEVTRYFAQRSASALLF